MSVFQFAYLTAPLFSLWVGFTGWPWWGLFIGVSVGLFMLVLDAVAMSLRAQQRLGTGSGMLRQMLLPLLSMTIPATIWNAVGYGIGRLVVQLLG